MLAATQAIVLLVVVTPPQGTLLHNPGECLYAAGGGPPPWLMLFAALTAVVSIILTVGALLLVIVRERKSGHSAELRSGQVWVRFSPTADRASIPRIIDPLLVIPTVTAAVVLTFAAFYVVLFSVDPSAFHLTDCRFGVTEALYFSIVTAATVGFGDISPASHAAEIAVMTQIVVTAFGLASFIATVLGRPAEENSAR